MKINRILWIAAAVSACALMALPALSEEDHLMGYKAKDAYKLQPPANPYNLTHEHGNETCELKKVAFYLTQSEMNGGDDARGGPAGDFVCYKAKCSPGGPLPDPDVDSQFGTIGLTSKKAKLVCLPVNPPPPACVGQLVGDFCWFLGGSGASCDATCSSMGKACDAAGTVSFAGTGGTLAQCDAVLDALLGPGNTDELGVADEGTGCGFYSSFSRSREVDNPTTCDASSAIYQRACACQ